MVVTSSRKEAVRYKLSFDKYITEKGYEKLYGMVAFSGEVEFSQKDPNSAGLLGEKFTEINMNPGLKGRDLRKAFDSEDYQVMIVANKFQTGFDQPKLCAMYVDKKLGGVECVQTLSRLNRVFPGKADTGTFVLDFFNEPEDILNAFQPYYQPGSSSGTRLNSSAWPSSRRAKAMRLSPISVNRQCSVGRSATKERCWNTRKPRMCWSAPKRPATPCCWRMRRLSIK